MYLYINDTFFSSSQSSNKENKEKLLTSSLSVTLLLWSELSSTSTACSSPGCWSIWLVGHTLVSLMSSYISVSGIICMAAVSIMKLLHYKLFLSLFLFLVSIFLVFLWTWINQVRMYIRSNQREEESCRTCDRVEGGEFGTTVEW